MDKVLRISDRVHHLVKKSAIRENRTYKAQAEIPIVEAIKARAGK